jgi:hypothetical protein
LPDFQISGGISEAISIKANWKASTAIIKYAPVEGFG